MNPRILNRDFTHPADDWYHIEAKGFHPNHRSKVVQVVDDKAVSSISTNFNRSAATGNLFHGSELLIDHEHFKHDKEKETTAYGWLQETQGRADGIYARNRWTATGKPAVDGGDYRFFSTEYDTSTPGNFEEVNSAEVPDAIRNKYTDYKFIRPLVLTGLTLTNQFNNRGQRPITNRDENNLQHTAATSNAEEQAAIQNRKKTTMKQIATRLGLSPDASEEAILGELTKVLNRADAAELKATNLTAELTPLKNRAAEFDKEQITDLFTARKSPMTKSSTSSRRCSPA